MKFKSAVDLWFYLLTLVLPIVIIPYVIQNIGTADPTSLGIIALVTFSTLGIPLWLLLSTYYLVEDRILKIRSGPVRMSIPLNEINSVKPSRSLLSSPALSIKRLKISYGANKTVLVSPKDEKGFRRAIGHI